MKRIVILLLCLALLLSSCSDHRQDSFLYDAFVAKISDNGFVSGLDKKLEGASDLSVSRLSYKASPDAVTTRTLTITGAMELNSIESNIKDFVNLYPDVEIVLEHYDDFFDFLDVFPVLLMTKKYGDLVLLEHMDSRIINENYFEDLYPYLYRDDFDEERYYMNILTSEQRDGKLFSINITFFPTNLFIMRKDIAPEYVDVFLNKEDLNYNDLVRMYLDIAAEARNRGEKFEILFDGIFNPIVFLRNNLDSLIDFEHKTARFTDPEFMALMERVKNEVYYGDNLVYTENGMELSPYYDLHDPYELEEIIDEEKRVLFSEAAFSLLVSAPVKERKFTTPRQIPTSAGNYYFYPNVSMAVSKDSQNKELAWEFIRFFMADKEIPKLKKEEASSDYVYYAKQYIFFVLFRGGMAANKENFEKGLVLEKNYYREDLKKNYPKLSLEQDYNLYFKEWYLPFIRKTMENCNKTYSEINGLYRLNSRGILWDDMYLYLTDKQTVEQTMQNIENKVNIWLNE